MNRNTRAGGKMAKIAVTQCAMLAGAPPLPPDYTVFEGKTALS